MHSKMHLLMTWVGSLLHSRFTLQKILTTRYAEEADNLFLVSIALGAMYMVTSVIEIFGVVSVSMVSHHRMTLEIPVFFN